MNDADTKAKILERIIGLRRTLHEDGRLDQSFKANAIDGWGMGNFLDLYAGHPL